MIHWRPDEKSLPVNVSMLTSFFKGEFLRRFFVKIQPNRVRFWKGSTIRWRREAKAVNVHEPWEDRRSSPKKPWNLLLSLYPSMIVELPCGSMKRFVFLDRERNWEYSWCPAVHSSQCIENSCWIFLSHCEQVSTCGHVRSALTLRCLFLQGTTRFESG